MVGRFNWKIAGMLAVVLGISAILSGCGLSEQAEDRPGMYPTTPDPSTIEQPSASTSNDAIEAYGEKYLIDFNEEDYVEKYSINTDVQMLANDDDFNGKIFWLDVDLLREEIAYADALAEAYDNGTCPEEIKDEAEILYFIKNYHKDDTNGQWAFFIASINSYYNIMALKSAEIFDYTSSESDCYNFYTTIVDGLLKIDEEDPIIYNLSKLIHEACCDAQHNVTESGYSYCSSLDGFQEYVQGTGRDAASTLRLSD